MFGVQKSPAGTSGNFTLLAAAMKARYGLIGQVIEGAAAAQAAVLAAAEAGPVVVGLAGDLFNLVPRYQDNHVVHAITVLYPNGTTGLQFDPLAPLGYRGDLFGPSELAKFATAAIIFKEEASMPGYKIGSNIGTFRFVGKHDLISPTDTVKGRFPQGADAGPWDVAASLDLKRPDGTPVDIDGNSPPLNGRDQVYLVDAPTFGVAALALRQDGDFTPKPVGFTQEQLNSAFVAGRADGIQAARDDLSGLV